MTAKQRPKLYLLAGNGSAADWWDEVLPYFSQYQAVAIELPGFGGNTSELPDSLSGLADALAAQTEPGHAIVATGISALPVLHLLVRKPGHFSRTVLLSPVGVALWRRRLPRLMQLPGLLPLAQWLLANFPRVFSRQFALPGFSPDYRRIARGYARCRAFAPYFRWVRPDNALTLFDQISDPIELLWGGRDGVIGAQHAAAWEAVLCRSALAVTFKPGWGHYPFWQCPADFVAQLERGVEDAGFNAHTKGGRLLLAQAAGLPVPALRVLRPGFDRQRLAAWLGSFDREAPQGWAVRSSGDDEDGIDCANAGRHDSFLRVPADAVVEHVDRLHAAGLASVVVQRMIEPTLSGVGFARGLAAEIEWVNGHLSALVDGRVQPQRLRFSKLGGEWGERPSRRVLAGALSERALWDFLQAVVRCFHGQALDIEWAWDGRQLWLLQARPVTRYGWQRWLTNANIGEILPPQPSRLIEAAQRQAAASIPQVYARWDARALDDAEPFTALHADASYINAELFLARLADWGIPGDALAREIGGSVPDLPARPWRWPRALPVLLRMLFASRRALDGLDAGLARWQAELDALIASPLSDEAQAKRLANWLMRFYTWLVQQNLCIGAAIASSGGAWLGRPQTQTEQRGPHRLPWESDPATPRPAVAAPSLAALPRWSWPLRLAHRLGLPGMRGYYLQTREQFRDRLMLLFFRLHHAFPASQREHWFAPVSVVRSEQGGFWQHGGRGDAPDGALQLSPGEVEGVLGEDILLVDALDPGLFEHYRQARGVVTRSGGLLSHGATMLRELKVPALAWADVPESWLGARVRLARGQLHVLG
ncbi:PEP-utilizing enzyme [Chitinilyticum litopenaei]|uniref:PEP-utilizing enzyme n=1 Tax=Chitinilyticum litopenaei TaxID=1121276 RepID=UPI0005BAB507|nr:PEP-utilizing enzyme [Chitinilyticum litopenaei]